MFRWTLIILVLLAATAGLALGVLNAEPVALNLVFGHFTLPLGGLVLMALATGILLGLLLAWLLFLVPQRFRRGRSQRKEKGTDLADHRNA